MSKHADSVRPFAVQHVDGDRSRRDEDQLAVEEPMEIRVVYGPDDRRLSRSLSVTMRTPGDDFELAAGFLFTERILRRPDQILKMEFCGPAAPGRSTSNIVRVEMDSTVELDLDKMERHFFAASSCGICGKASLDAVHVKDLPPLDPQRLKVRENLIGKLPDLLRSNQPIFESTGGTHATTLFDADGTMHEVREDVGRHNAVDKLLGRCFLDGRTPLADRFMVVSGRASFEILQKALAAGVPMIVAVGAPSSLAVDLAERFGMTLVGFASSERFNVYSGFQRILH